MINAIVLSYEVCSSHEGQEKDLAAIPVNR